MDELQEALEETHPRGPRLVQDAQFDEFEFYIKGAETFGIVEMNRGTVVLKERWRNGGLDKWIYEMDRR